MPVNSISKRAKSQHQLAFLCCFCYNNEYLIGEDGDITKLLRKLKNTFLSKGFIEFCVLGLINTFNDSFFSWMYSLIPFVGRGNLAAVLGYATALSIAYLLTSKIIFKSQPSGKSYVRFVISYIPNFIIFYLVTFITINTWHLHQFWATAIAAAAGGPITYVIIKIYAFRKK